MANKKNDKASERVPLATAAIPIVVGLFLALMCVVVVGFLYHPIYSVAAPFVCGGDMEFQTIETTTEEGGTGLSNQVTCVDDGERRDITWPAALTASLIYAIIFSAILVPLWFRYAKPGGVE